MPTKKATTTHVALLRGINVGGKNKLPMKELVAIFEGVGCTSVRTYIQSGNVLYAASRALAPKVPRLVSAGIEERLGLSIPVVVRTVAELGAVARAHPLAQKGVDPKWLHVVFLADRPGKAAVGALDPELYAPDAFTVRGGEVFVRYANGAGRSKLTNAVFDAKLKTVSTARNWNTVQKLVALADG